MIQTASVLAAIDRANSHDPQQQDGQPAALLYGQRMTEMQRKLYPDASELLQIACRGQHIERWLLPRDSYPMDRAGYLQWRQEQGRRHAERVAGIMAESGYGPDQIDPVRRMLMKQGIKRDPDVQALEDVACFTFIRWYLGDFAADQPDDKLQRIVERTARKMSAMARSRALEEFAMPDTLARYFRAE